MADKNSKKINESPDIVSNLTFENRFMGNLMQKSFYTD
jgi:hypothetical protein